MCLRFRVLRRWIFEDLSSLVLESTFSLFMSSNKFHRCKNNFSIKPNKLFLRLKNSEKSLSPASKLFIISKDESTHETQIQFMMYPLSILIAPKELQFFRIRLSTKQVLKRAIFMRSNLPRTWSRIKRASHYRVRSTSQSHWKAIQFAVCALSSSLIILSILSRQRIKDELQLHKISTIW